MLIQYIATIIIAVIIFQLFTKLKKDRMLLTKTLVWTVFWSVALFIIWFPDVIAKIAKISGVGRGVDIIIYVSIILLFYLVFNQNSKFDELNKQITKLTRKIAKENVKEK